MLCPSTHNLAMNFSIIIPISPVLILVNLKAIKYVVDYNIKVKIQIGDHIVPL